MGWVLGILLGRANACLQEDYGSEVDSDKQVDNFNPSDKHTYDESKACGAEEEHTGQREPMGDT